jgi:hypothetical protein
MNYIWFLISISAGEKEKNQARDQDITGEHSSAAAIFCIFFRTRSIHPCQSD